MFDHSNCTHPKTKVARASCRRAHTEAPSVTSKASGAKARSPRLPSLIAPKVRPLIDAAKQRGLTVRLSHDAPDGVEQMFVITSKRKPNCQLVLEAFAAVSKGREGKAEFYRVEDDQTRQLSKARVIAELDNLANA